MSDDQAEQKRRYAAEVVKAAMNKAARPSPDQIAQQDMLLSQEEKEQDRRSRQNEGRAIVKAGPELEALRKTVEQETFNDLVKNATRTQGLGFYPGQNEEYQQKAKAAGLDAREAAEQVVRKPFQDERIEIAEQARPHQAERSRDAERLEREREENRQLQRTRRERGRQFQQDMQRRRGDG